MNLELSMIPKSGVISTNFEEIKEKLETEMSTYKTMTSRPSQKWQNR